MEQPVEYTELSHCALFEDMSKDELSAVLSCLDAKTRRYKKGEFILKAGTKLARVGVVLAGCAHLIQEDYWGNRLLIAQALPGEEFGEAFACSANEVLSLSVYAAQDTTVLFIDYQRIVTVCSSACTFHVRLIKNMLLSMAQKNISLTRKIEHTSKRNVQEKILSYLSAQALLANSPHFEISFTRQELADYLAVDRASLCRALGALQDQGFIAVQGRNITLLNNTHDQ